MEATTVFHIVLLIMMSVALVLALVSEALRNRFVASEPIFALGIGALAGPFALDLVDLGYLTADVPALIEELSRLTLAVAILTATLRVGWSWTRCHLRDLAIVLLLVLPAMWALTFVALQLVLPTALLVTLLIAAVLTPTDPVLAQAIVTSTTAEEQIPADLRHLLSAESAANDGLALLFVMICVLLVDGHGPLDIGSVSFLLFWEIGGALILGAAAGWTVGKLMSVTEGRWATEAGLIGRTTSGRDKSS